MTTIRPAEARKELTRVDARIAVLEEWRGTLKFVRQRYERMQLDPSGGSGAAARACDAIQMIDDGPRGGGMRPSDPELAPFDQGGRPGLVNLERELARLRQQRDLLKSHLPDEAAVDAASREAASLAESYAMQRGELDAAMAAFAAVVDAGVEAADRIHRSFAAAAATHARIAALVEDAGIEREPAAPAAFDERAVRALSLKTQMLTAACSPGPGAAGLRNELQRELNALQRRFGG